MAKGTIIFIIILGLFASLLLGFRLGKLSNSNINSTVPTLLPTITVTPQISNLKLQILNYDKNIATPTSSLKPESSAKSVYSDKSCGFSLSFPSSFLNSKTNNGQSTIYTNPDNPDDTVVTACLAEIPKPPLPADKIEVVTLDGVEAKLYHDSSSKDGSPRDEAIVTHPRNGLQIIIAGYGKSFQMAISSFKFI